MTITDPAEYRRIHDIAAAAYEAAVPVDYRYSALALRKAVDAAISAYLAITEPGKPESGVLAEAVKVAGYLFEMRYESDRWSGTMFAEQINLPVSDVRNVRRLYSTPPKPVAEAVKALEWRDGRNEETVFDVVQHATILGAEELVGLEYTILGPDRHGLFEVILGDKVINFGNSDEQAKVVAQLDYQRRIMSALTTPPQPVEAQGDKGGSNNG